jgi:nucleosome binding factor SPN SPT16 subunit
MFISDKTHYYISKSRNEANKIDIRSIQMKINNIVKLNLETRAKDLRANGKSFAAIAKVLSHENKIPLRKILCKDIFWLTPMRKPRLSSVRIS